MKYTRFVLDEADEMLKMGFVDDVTWIMEQAPETAQRVLFSATMPPIVKQIVDRFLRSPERIDVAGENRTVSKVEQQFWVVKGVEKDEAMSRLLETEETDASIVFVRTRQDTERLADWLSARGFKAAALHGDIPQSLRERTVDHIKKGVIDILVATDVVARGLDVPRITHVFNYDIPFDVESYIHRIGRTGRAGRTGKAILLVRTNQIRMLRTIERVTKSRMEEIQLPLRDVVAEARLTRLGQELQTQKEEINVDAFVELVEKLQESIEVDAATLAAMLLQRQQGNRPLFYKGPDPMIAAIERDKQRRERRRDDRGGERGERRERRSYNNADWDTYQLQVGREQGVQVKDIVGAIANELGLSKEFIGAIKLAPEHTYVQLPKKMTAEVSAQLKKLRIRQNDVKAVVVEGEVFFANTVVVTVVVTATVVATVVTVMVATVVMANVALTVTVAVITVVVTVVTAMATVMVVTVATTTLTVVVTTHKSKSLKRITYRNRAYMARFFYACLLVNTNGHQGVLYD